MSDVIQMLNICNACRYCEGHCAVFPALERRLVFEQSDIELLTNLCHQCGACYHNCQYAPPHEFGVNLPSVLEAERQKSFAKFNSLDLAIRYPIATTVLSTVLATLCFALAINAQSDLFLVTDNFYQLLPHRLMALSFSLAALVILVNWMYLSIRYWRSVGLPAPWRIKLTDWYSATRDALTLKNLDGGHGDGCHVDSDRPTLSRRRWHHWVLLGFMLCFAATLSGTALHYAWKLSAPYGWLTLPKLFGMTGGFILVVGCVGLLSTGRRTDNNTQYRRQFSSSLTWLLLLVALSGLVLPFLKENLWLGSALSFHLGLVFSLFLNFGWGKFQHSLFRSIALLADAYERRNERRRL